MNEEMNQGTGAAAAGAQQQGKEKLFTQEEVNGFIQARLAQMKKQAGKESSAEIEQRLKDIEAREMHLLVREKLQERGMPAGLADILTCTSEDDLNQKLDRINEIYGGNKKEEQPRGFQIGSTNRGEDRGPDPVRRAFGLSR